MEMCYDGALVMPSSYAVMGEEEMTYVEGGGTVSVYISKRAKEQFITIGAGLAVGLVCQALTTNPYVAIVAGALAALVVDYVLNNVWSVKATNVSFTRAWLPNFKFSYK